MGFPTPWGPSRYGKNYQEIDPCLFLVKGRSPMALDVIVEAVTIVAEASACLGSAKIAAQ